MTDHAKLKEMLAQILHNACQNRELMETKDKRIKELEAKMERMWEELQQERQRTKLAQREISNLNMDICKRTNANIVRILETWHSG